MSRSSCGLPSLWEHIVGLFAKQPRREAKFQEEPPSEKPQPFHVAIVGAGIGGLALAIALNRHGVPFTVYESAAAYATIGAGVGIGPNAMRAMDAIDKRFRGEYDKVCIGNLTPGKEHVMMEAAMIEDGLGAKRGWQMRPWGSQNYTRTAAHRKDLLDIMTALMPEGCVKFNKRLEGLTEVTDGIEIQFADGESTKVSAVIGCDGVKGFTRRYVLSPDHEDEVMPKYAHQYAYRAIIPLEEARKILGDLANDARMYFGKKVNLSTYIISEGREINVVGFVRDEEAWETSGRVTREVTRERMKEDFAKCNVDERIMKLLEVSERQKVCVDER
jgi:salicylate hydroxylase